VDDYFENLGARGRSANDRGVAGAALGAEMDLAAAPK
jgi:hypothetical protein